MSKLIAKLYLVLHSCTDMHDSHIVQSSCEHGCWSHGSVCVCVCVCVCVFVHVCVAQ